MKYTSARLLLSALTLCGVAFAQTPAAAPKTAPKATAPAAKAAPSGTAAKAAPKASSKAAPPTAAKAVPKATQNIMNPATLREKAPSVFIVKLVTSKGDVTIRVNRAWAPLGAERFYNLVKAGFYDNCYFFRNLDFMAQVGISSKPEINRIWSDKTFFDDRPIQSNRRGAVTFAKTEAPNSRSTQIFINKLDQNTYLDSAGFAPFGEVLEGMEVVDKLYTGYQQTPSQDLITNQGEPYLNRNFPRLDKIITARVIAIPTP